MVFVFLLYTLGMMVTYILEVTDTWSIKHLSTLGIIVRALALSLIWPIHWSVFCIKQARLAMSK